MNKIKGYCTINKNATTGIAQNLESFLGKDLRVLDFSVYGDVLVVNSEATEIAMFDKVDVYRSFKCKIVGDVICPPDLNLVDELIYVSKVKNRKGGYNDLLRRMVIQASLMKGRLIDSFLFEMQD